MPFITLLYYKYVEITDPEAERVYQRNLCERLGLKGRILIAAEGINGTVAGTEKQTNAYMEAMSHHEPLSDINYKVEASSEIPFPRLRIKVRDEVVTLGVPVDLANTAERLSPEAFNEMIKRDDVVLFDARNNYESAIGHFEGAVRPDISLFKDFPTALDEHEDLKDKAVVTYCTGGIRCEKASALMKERGFKNVYQLDGGIIKYAQAYPDGAFKGSLFVFDERMSVTYGETNPITTCNFCDQLTSTYINCANPECHQLLLVCNDCRPQNKTCSVACQGLIAV